jgi:hypothetical protein
VGSSLHLSLLVQVGPQQVLWVDSLVSFSSVSELEPELHLLIDSSL